MWEPGSNPIRLATPAHPLTRWFPLHAWRFAGVLHVCCSRKPGNV